VTGITPSSAVAGSTLSGVEITGSGFVSGAEVILQSGADGSTAVFASGETVVNAGLLRCTLALGANAYPAAYTVWLRNPGGSWVALEDGFTVTAALAPTVTGISPATGARGATLSTVSITGTNFLAGAEVIVEGGTSGTTSIFASSETVINAGLLRCTLAVPSTAYRGPYTVWLRNPGGSWVYLENGFTVT